MATRALAVAGSRAAGQVGLAVLSSSRSCCRRGGTHSFSHSTAERELQEGHADADADATAEQVEAALNRKNVDVVEGNHSATLLAAEALRGVGDAAAAAAAGADDAWVPDQETGVFVPPADEASGDGNGADDGGARGPSVLDQAVFVREEDMEDVERPAVGGSVDVPGAAPSDRVALPCRRPAAASAWRAE